MTTTDLQDLSKEELIKKYLALESKYELYKKNSELQMAAKDQEIARLSEQLESFRQEKYGLSSEQLDRLMQKAINEPEEIFDHSDASQTEEPKADDILLDPVLHPEKQGKGKASKKGIPKTKHLDTPLYQVIEEHHHFDDGFLKDHPDIKQTSPYVWEEIIPVNAKIIKVRHIVDQYRSEDRPDIDGNDQVVRPDDSPRPLFDRSVCSPEMIAKIVYEKYFMAIPITRQSKDLRIHGMDLSKQVLSSWTLKAWDMYGSLLFDAMHEDLKAASIVHGDETHFNCLETRRTVGNKTNYFVQGSTGKSDEKQMVLFFYRQNRKGEFVEQIFGKGDPSRILHSDAYQPYFGAGFKNIPCMDHIRRGFVKALKLRVEELKIYGQLCAEKDERKRKEAIRDLLSKEQHRVFADLLKILDLIKKLYQNERNYQEQGLSAQETAQKRQSESRPIFEELEKTVEPFVSAKVKKIVRARNSGKTAKPGKKGQDIAETPSKVAPKSQMGMAANYYWKLKDYYVNFLEDGRAVLSNQKAENGMRPVALLRNNSYFFDTESGAQAGGGYLSLLQSAQINGLKPEEYLIYVFRQLKDHPYSKELVQGLLPYSKTLPEELKMKDPA